MRPHKTPKQEVERVPTAEQIVQRVPGRGSAEPQRITLCSTHHIQT
jgi:hypothetical protein